MIKIGQIGGSLKNGGEDIYLSDRVNLSDFDVILFDIQYLNEELGEEVEECSNEDLDELIDNYRKSIIQMKDFYHHGGISIAFLSDQPNDLLEVDQNDENGNLNVFDFLHLNINKFEFELMEGSAIDYHEPIDGFTTLFGMRYYYTMKSYEGKPIMRSKKKRDVIGIKKNIGKGICYLLPAFEDAFNIENTSNSERLRLMLNEIIQLNSRNEFEKTVIPSWIDEFSIYNEQIYLDKRNALLKEISTLENRLSENSQHLLRFQNLKKLIYSGDDELEIAVQEAFIAIGFQVIVPEGNNDDLILIEQNFKAVVEVKGVTKSGTTMHVMQLEKWASNYGLENEGQSAKGILVLNPFKEKKPSDRKENPFPKDMINFSIPRGHCLMLSEDLLNIFIDFNEKLISKMEIQQLLNKTIGVLKYIPSYIKQSSVE